MTISILRTAEAWWVHTASGAARIATDAATTRELVADRSAIEAAERSTDTVPVDELNKPHNIEVLSISGLLAETIQNVFSDDSVSAIFAGENQLF